MSDTEILMSLQKDISHQNGLLEQFVESQTMLNKINSEQHGLIFEKVEWLKTRTVLLLFMVGTGGGTIGGFLAKLL